MKKDLYLNEKRKASLFNLIWDNSLVGISIVGKDGKFIMCNDTFCKITEYTESELTNRTFQQITHPDDVHSDVEMAKGVSEKDRCTYDMKKRYITKTGKIVWITLKVLPYEEESEFKFFVSQVSSIDPSSPYDVLVNKSSFDLSKFLKKYKVSIISVTGSFIVIVKEVMEKIHGN